MGNFLKREIGCLGDEENLSKVGAGIDTRTKISALSALIRAF
jgi:hypothetical protein